ncbi:unnamed protein product [Rhizophagus irregularis]|uniref:Uncharacterized protein n=1 Tax=Rhizophagus irregularis TaxID=588596 RepID=A0A2I1HPH5_9GLOM|nr:hypothetical protein RhiirA4_484924 [Rhizophagus irregularis]CAB4437581.1 unnamed protein product [Rhizophagus irregularis]CAB4437678.1 unnamed protein product [Rhizophagus irregularis]
MKLSIPLTIVAIICIIALEQIEAFNTTLAISVFFSQCKVWATDNFSNIVMDTGWLNCEEGDPDPTYHIREITANPYWLHAKVMGSKRKTKHRGPFNSNTCFKFNGNVFKWGFDQYNC